MSNERLRDAVLSAGESPTSLGEQLGVDPKTVERWITQGRTPYARHRMRVATLLGQRESYLWPDAVSPERAERASRSELVELYPRRALVTPGEYERLFSEATVFIDILVYPALFLPERCRLLATPSRCVTIVAPRALGPARELMSLSP